MDLFKKMGGLAICKSHEAFNFTVNPLVANRKVAATVKNITKKVHQRKGEGHRERENRRSPPLVEEDPMVVGNELSNEDRKKRSELREQAKKVLRKATSEKNES